MVITITIVIAIIVVICTLTSIIINVANLKVLLKVLAFTFDHYPLTINLLTCTRSLHL